MSVAIIISISIGILLLLGSIAFLVWYYRDILFGNGGPSPSPMISPVSPPATPPSPATTPPSPMAPQPSKNTETASPAPV
jgi:hypothetical protein